MAESAGFSSAVIDAMNSMTKDPKKSAALVHDDTCLGGLVMVLSNKDPHIVHGALQVLYKLGQWPELREHMKTFLGMMDQLQALMARAGPELQDLAKRVQDLLNSGSHSHSNSAHVPIIGRPSHGHTGGRPTPGAHVPSRDDQSQTSLRDTSNIARPTKETNPKRRRNSFFLGGISKSKMIVLQIRGLYDKEDMEVCRNSILTVKGVISITFEFKKKRIVLRTVPSLKPELLAQAIARTMTMVAEQVIKDDQGNEVMLSFGSHAASLNKENEDLPDYPPDDSPVRGEKDVARVGQATPQKPNATWVGAVGNFLSNSFYW